MLCFEWALLLHAVMSCCHFLIIIIIIIDSSYMLFCTICSGVFIFFIIIYLFLRKSWAWLLINSNRTSLINKLHHFKYNYFYANKRQKMLKCMQEHYNAMYLKVKVRSTCLIFNISVRSPFYEFIQNHHFIK